MRKTAVSPYSPDKTYQGIPTHRDRTRRRCAGPTGRYRVRQRGRGCRHPRPDTGSRPTGRLAMRAAPRNGLRAVRGGSDRRSRRGHRHGRAAVPIHLAANGLDRLPGAALVRVLVLRARRVVRHRDRLNVHGERTLVILGHTASPFCNCQPESPPSPEHG